MSHSTSQADSSSGQVGPVLSPSEKPDMMAITVTSKTAKTPLGFLGLVQDIRAIIYVFLLRPDCQSLKDQQPCHKPHFHDEPHSERTSILRTCKTVYSEAVEVLYKEEVVVEVPYRGQPVFRHPRMAGRGDCFAFVAPDQKVLVPQRFSELQFLRLRKIALIIPLPQIDPRHKRRSHIGKDYEYNAQFKIRDLTKALSKSINVESIRIFLTRRAYDHPHLVHPSMPSYNGPKPPGLPKQEAARDQELRLLTLLAKLIMMAADKGCKISLGRHDIFSIQESHNDEPLVPRLMRVASEAGVRIEGMNDPPSDYVRLGDDPYMPVLVPFQPKDAQYRPHIIVDRLTGEQSQPATEIQPIDEFQPYDEAQPTDEVKPIDRVQPKLVYGLLEEDLTGVNSITPYQLLPECRSCYALFSSIEQLHNHLEAHTDHRTSFRAKAWNVNLIPDRDSRGKQCELCADEALRGRDQDWWNMMNHIKTYHEDFAGASDLIIPRYEEDREWWKVQWKKFEEGKMEKGAASVLGGTVV